MLWNQSKIETKISPLFMSFLCFDGFLNSSVLFFHCLSRGVRESLNGCVGVFLNENKKAAHFHQVELSL